MSFIDSFRNEYFPPNPHIKSGYLLWYMLNEENTNKKPSIRPRYRIVQSMNSWLIMKQSKVPAESDGKPVDEQSWFHNSNISLVSVVFIILENGLLVEIIDWAMIHSSEIFTFARVERISLEAMVSSGYSFLIRTLQSFYVWAADSFASISCFHCALQLHTSYLEHELVLCETMSNLKPSEKYT